VLSVVDAFNTASKPSLFICHAGWVPISAGNIKGRRATSVELIRDDMVIAGANWVDEPCVVDGNLISARAPADRGPWMKASWRHSTSSSSVEFRAGHPGGPRSARRGGDHRGANRGVI
jgi:protease I